MRPHGLLVSPAALLIFVSLWPCAALAQANYHFTPLGGRSALLGGTGVALGADGAAPFLNPASIVRIGDRRIAFSARFFRLAHRTLDDFHQPGPVNPAFGPLSLPDTTRTSLKLASVPDTTCYFFSRSRGEGAELRGRSKLALCLAKTAEQEFELTAISYRGESAGRQVDQTHSFREVWSSWSLGPTFALHVTETLTLGASLHLTRTRHETTTSVATVVEELATSAGVASAYQSADSGSSWDALAQIGMTYRASKTLTLAASLQAPSLHFTGSYSANEDARFSSDTSSLSHWSGEGDFVARRPLRLNLGIGAEYERVRLEANVFLHAPVEEFAHAELDRHTMTGVDGTITGRTQGRLTRNESVRGVANAGFGAEYFLSKDLSLLMGVASDVSALRVPAGGLNEQRLFHSRFDAWHAGVGLSTYTDYGDLVVGLRGDYLTGEVASVNAFSQPIERERIPAREWAAMLVIAGRVSLSTVAEAAEAVGEAVRGGANKPTPTLQKPLQAPKID
ncbi:MAG TPA: hypothetical protein VK524_21970 [Polyangiaceae bacterium]|nr:hypothetical protein [Polyangiaceae bacterium]